MKMDKESYMFSKGLNFGDMQLKKRRKNRSTLTGNSSSRLIISLSQIALHLLSCYLFVSTYLIENATTSPSGTLSVSSVLPTTIVGSKTVSAKSSGSPAISLKPGSDLRRHLHVTPISIKTHPSSGQVQSARTRSSDLAQLEKNFSLELTPFYYGDSSSPSDNKADNYVDEDSTTKRWIEQRGSPIEAQLVPEMCYIDLVGQFNNWVWRYRKLAATYPQGELKSVPELLKVEFGHANQELEMEMCSSLSDLSPQSNDIRKEAADLDNSLDSKFDKLDYVYRSLMKLLSRLEKLTSQLEKARGENSPEIEETDHSIANDDEKFSRNMERTKRVALSFAAKVIKYELKSVSTVEAFNSMAYFDGAANPAKNPNNFISIFSKIVESLGSGSTPVTVSYLRDAGLRSALSILNANDPLPWIVCAIKKSPNKIEKTC